jgi:hypothetical protein
MIARVHNLISLYGAIPASGRAVRATWSRAISLRADVKLSPCMARPNLFSGD